MLGVGLWTNPCMLAQKKCLKALLLARHGPPPQMHQACCGNPPSHDPRSRRWVTDPATLPGTKRLRCDRPAADASTFQQPFSLERQDRATWSSWSARTRAAIASTIGTARGTTQGSWRPRATSSTDSPARLTVFCLRAIVDVGLKAIFATMCSPFERPP